MDDGVKWRFMPTFAKSGTAQILLKLILIALCALCLQPLCSCVGQSGDAGIADHAVKYANSRIKLDMTSSCVVKQLSDAKVEISLAGLRETSDGMTEIAIEPIIVSDTMASWSADEWAANRDDLFFNFVAHFSVICKQANKYGDIPENYVVTCPDYVVVYDSRRSDGFVVASNGVYRKTEDPTNPIGEEIDGEPSVMHTGNDPKQHSESLRAS